MSANRIPVSKNMPNFRHMGGYLTRSGRVTRGDRLFRSGWFELNCASDVERFSQLNISRVFDFRTDLEKERRPLNLNVANPPEVIDLEIGHGNMGVYLQRISEVPSEDIDCRSEMIVMYSRMLDDARSTFSQFFDYLKGTTSPILLMCSTGKDRTGVASALLLLALGVPRVRVMEDFLISADVYRGRELEFARRHGFDQEAINLSKLKDLYTVDEQYLDAALNRAIEVAGDFGAFLEECLGVKHDAVTAMQANFTSSGSNNA